MVRNIFPGRKQHYGLSLPGPDLTVHGTIFNIMRYAVHDGPGIRTTVFLKGCPLSCPWCHNPEGLRGGIEIAYHVERCVLCGECVNHCPQHALTLEETRVSRDTQRCVVCGSCTDQCVMDARESIGREIGVEDLIAEVLKDRIFYDESGGGVTFSGGEPLHQFDFLLPALKACKANGLHTAVETSGLTTPDRLEEVCAYTDLFLFDVKLIDEERHKQLTGWSNVRIMENLRYLASRNASVAVRVPVIPGVNDDDENIRGLARLLTELGTVREVHLLPYHAGAASKYAGLGMRHRMTDVSALPGQRLEEIAETLTACGFTVRRRG